MANQRRAVSVTSRRNAKCDQIFSVARSARGRGIGKQLMATILNIADNERAAVLATTPESHHAAIGLYSRKQKGKLVNSE